MHPPVSLLLVRKRSIFLLGTAQGSAYGFGHNVDTALPDVRGNQAAHRMSGGTEKRETRPVFRIMAIPGVSRICRKEGIMQSSSHRRGKGSPKHTPLPALSGGGVSTEAPAGAEGQTALLDKKRARIALPPMYKVILLNDDFTPMDFVVEILRKFFRKNASEARRIMLQVHHCGRGLCGVFPVDIAETKACEVMDTAQRSSYPLRCVLEPEHVSRA